MPSPGPAALPRSSGLDALRRLLAEQAFSRAAGAPLVLGNRVDLLLDASENYPAWKQAIADARRTVHLEMYIFHDDEVGREFHDLLVRKAREGVTVRVLYDWLGAFRKTGEAFWSRMRAGGVEVRCCNPPRLESPLGWIRRDHRKVISVDGEVAFVSGLCIGQDWVGRPERGLDPWRDTGLAIRGPAVADVERAFAEAWASEGAPMASETLPRREDVEPVGDQALRVIATSPDATGLMRLDLLWASIARERLWLSDAYFVGTPAYLGALRAAAAGGVDVRLLVPSASDIQVLASFSRTQYRPLLESGVRVFEWNGSMMHAKSAVVDGHWSRVGSTNLNLASWVGNWELDVCVDDDTFGSSMEEAYLRDLEHSTEILIEARDRVRPVHEPEPRVSGGGSGRRAGSASRQVAPGSAGRAAAAALEIGGRMGVAITRRSLGPKEARSLTLFGVGLVGVASIAFLLPRILTVPIGLVTGWMGFSLLTRARRVRREERERLAEGPGDPPPLR